MKKLLIYFLFAAIGYKFYSDYTGNDPLSSLTIPTKKEHTFSVEGSLNSFHPDEEPEESFQCDGRQHCSEMRTYKEALFFLRNCPDTKMDGDGDGVPCERQFNR